MQDEDKGNPLGEVEGNPLDEVEGDPLGRAHYRLPHHARRLSLSSSPEKGRARCKGGEEGIRRAKRQRRRIEEERAPQIPSSARRFSSTRQRSLLARRIPFSPPLQHAIPFSGDDDDDDNRRA